VRARVVRREDLAIDAGAFPRFGQRLSQLIGLRLREQS
jgi:hypothetical protein